MKARTIRKLRKRLGEYKTYIVIPAADEIFRFCDKNAYKVKASDNIHAIERYMEYYWRKHKQRSRYYSEIYHEVNYYDGGLCVIDEKGYMRYYI